MQAFMVMIVLINSILAYVGFARPQIVLLHALCGVLLVLAAVTTSLKDQMLSEAPRVTGCLCVLLQTVEGFVDEFRLVHNFALLWSKVAWSGH
eukprot:1631392-Amphidinium_carterae.1